MKVHHHFRSLGPAAFLVTVLTSFALARADELNYPLDITAAGEKTLYIADRYVPGVWKVEATKLSLFFKGSKKFRTPLNAIRCIITDANGKLVAGDSSTREVYRFDDDGKPTPLTAAGIGIPMGIADDGKGNLFVTDLEVHRIWKVPSKGGKPVEFATLPAPRGITIDAKGNLLVVSHGKNQLVRITPEGKVEPFVKGRPFAFPHDVVLDKSGIAYVSDGYGKAVWKVDESGKPTKWATDKQFVNPVGLGFNGDNLLIVDSRAKAVFQIDPEGKVSKLTFEK